MKVVAEKRQRCVPVLVLFLLVTIAGCGRRDLTEAERRAISWVNETPPPAVNTFTSAHDRELLEMFDLEAWDEAGRQIPDLENVIVRLLERQDPRLHIGKAWLALNDIATPNSLPFLVAQASSEQRSVERIVAIGILGRVGKGNERVRKVLSECLFDSQLDCSVAAAEVLAQVFPEGASQMIEMKYRCLKSTCDRMEKALARARADANAPNVSTEQDK